MHECTRIPGARNGSQADHKRNNSNSVSTWQEERENQIESILFGEKFSSRFPISWYQLRVSSNRVIYETFGLVPEIKSAEKLLHEHEVETTTSFVTYYSYGVSKAKSKVRGAPQMNRWNIKWRDAGVMGLWGD